MKGIRKALLCAVAAALLLSGAAAESQGLDWLRGAYRVEWAGGDWALLIQSPEEDVHDVVRISTGKTALRGVQKICDAECCVIAAMPDGRWFRLMPDGEIFRANQFLLSEFQYLTSQHEMVFSHYSDEKWVPHCFVYNAQRDEIVFQGEKLYIPFGEAYRSPLDGQTRLLLANGSILRADGTPLVDTGCSQFVMNLAGYDSEGHSFEVDGRIAAVRASDGKAVVLSADTGEEIASFDGYWKKWEADSCLIYQNNTAQLAAEPEGWGKMLVGLDGEILLRFDPESEFRFTEKTSYSPYYYYMNGNSTQLKYDRSLYSEEVPRVYDGRDYEVGLIETYFLYHLYTGQRFLSRYDTELDEQRYQSLETGQWYEELPQEGPLLPERLEKYPPAFELEEVDNPLTGGTSMAIFTWDGQLLGGRWWAGVLDWDYGHVACPFKELDFCRVRDESGRWGVLNREGDLVLPLVFDDLNPASIGWWDGSPGITIVPGRGFVARRDGQWYIYDLQGNLLY